MLVQLNYKVSVQRMSLLQAGNSLRLWIQMNRQNWRITASDILTAAHTHTHTHDTERRWWQLCFADFQRGVSCVADAICWELNLSRCKSLCRHHMDQHLCHTHGFKPLWEELHCVQEPPHNAGGHESHCWHVVCCRLSNLWIRRVSVNVKMSLFIRWQRKEQSYFVNSNWIQLLEIK